MSAALRASIRRTLLRWYDRHRRDLPWRRRPGDGYAQWVAEVMLQQTRVDTVIDRYECFLQRFPSIEALSAADHEDVLKCWEGLGYYRRALHLHAAARELSRKGAELPRTSVELRALPGIGEYMAGAIASIAFGEPVAAVDGNVGRVVARLFGIDEDVRGGAGLARVRRIAAELVPTRRPGDFNQAWMDLGSAVCVPGVPLCAVCPLSAHCAALATGRTEALPVRAVRRAVPRVRHVAGFITRGGMFLARKRPSGGLWSGLWEFPNVPMADGESPLAAMNRMLDRLGFDPAGPARDLGVVTHRLTHREMEFVVFEQAVRADRGGTGETADRWVDRDAFAALSVSTCHRKIADLVGVAMPG